MKQLQTLPKGLYETYDQILLKIDNLGDRMDTKTFLQWLSFSACPMSLEEMSEVVVVNFESENGPEYTCQNSEVVRGYGVTDRVHRRSSRADKMRLQLVCCALIQEPGCLVISEGRSPERGTGFRNGLRELRRVLWRVKQEE